MVETAEDCAAAASLCVGPNCATVLGATSSSALPMHNCDRLCNFPRCFLRTDFPMHCWNEHGSSVTFWANTLLLCKRLDDEGQASLPPIDAEATIDKPIVVASLQGIRRNLHESDGNAQNPEASARKEKENADDGRPSQEAARAMAWAVFLTCLVLAAVGVVACFVCRHCSRRASPHARQRYEQNQRAKKQADLHVASRDTELAEVNIVVV